ncbi:hypothetical protein RI444_16550 [Paenarthrobacter sp. AT5]|nr:MULTISPECIES: hypothetical protein [Paenarthrobacter]WOC60109.1 hypothetical protein RI444_16550 [Paenarthrobacter sp. AT5]
MSASENGQVTAEQLKAMGPEEIVRAQREGRLDGLLGRSAEGTQSNG